MAAAQTETPTPADTRSSRRSSSREHPRTLSARRRYVRTASVGYESLARGPVGSPFESPDALFAAAAIWADCRTGLDLSGRGVHRGTRRWRVAAAGAVPLFLNCEPTSFGTACPRDLEPVVRAAHERLSVVMEVTERDIARDPAALLSAVAQARELSWGIALDDVGAEPHSMAMMPFINPDVVKLDLRLIQGRTTAEVAMIVNAVLAHAERTGATVLAEGIETHRHEEVARAMGATIGQGWLYGRPAPLPSVCADTDQSSALTRCTERAGEQHSFRDHRR